MTLEEAIANAEVVARREEYNYKTYAQAKPRNDDDKARCEYAAKSCLKSAAEHRQLAKWLKELKTGHDEIDDADDEDEIFVGYLRKKMESEGK